LDPVLAPQSAAMLAQAGKLRAAGKVAEAAAVCVELIRRDPDNTDGLLLLGSLAMQTGATELAIGSLERAVAAAPKSADAYIRLGEALTAGKRAQEAVTVFRKALTLRLKDGAAFRGLAQAQLDAGNRDDALKSFRKVLTVLPYDQYAAHMAAALSGEESKLTSSYVQDLFDHYSEHFDQHLTETLGYRVPAAIRDVLGRHHSAGGLTALDLGCGTGLVAPELQGIVAAIDGVDISRQMVAKARERGLYRELRAGDLLEVLNRDQDFSGPYDLVTAADVFIYVGQLEEVFPAIRQVLVPAGLFAFSVEHSTNGPIAVRSSGRFAHAVDYIGTLADQHGFRLLERQDMPIRHERNEPIPGALYLLQAE
jgi:predicted TPR repeat methyltransferase